ncbi:MAG: ribosome maturation factor RimP [Gammaproteobacteria bacterium]
MRDRLVELLEPTVNGLGYELLGIERGRSGGGDLVRLYIDQDEGITVEDCEQVSRQVSDVLDVEDAIAGEYTLEVSSPGVDRPLFTLDQHTRFIGEEIRLKLRKLVNGRRRVAGVLRAVRDESLIVDVEGEEFSVPYPEVERSRLSGEVSLAGRRS